jgi:hypothetical protein
VRLVALTLIAATACARPFIDPYDAGAAPRDAGPPADACPPLSAVRIDVSPVRAGIGQMADLGDGRLLALVRTISSPSTTPVELDGDGVMHASRFDLGGRDVPTAVRHGDTVFFSVWEPGNVGRIHVAPRNGGLLSPTTSTAAEPFGLLFAPPSKTALELLAVGHPFQRRGVYRHSDTSFVELFHKAKPNPPLTDGADAVWLDEDRALILPWGSDCRVRSPCIFRYSRGATTVDEEPLDLVDDGDQASAMALVPGLGVVIGTVRGHFFLRSEAGILSILGLPPYGAAPRVIRRIRAYGDGFVAVTWRDLVRFSAAERRFCDEITPLSPAFEQVYEARVVGASVFVAGLSLDGNVGFVERFSP